VWVNNATGAVGVVVTNLVRDGRWEYSWDAENRLVRVTSSGSVDLRRVDWTYDAMGRRVRQVRYVWTNSTWQVVEDLKLVSDPGLFGRHIVELNGTNGAVVRWYVWGLDVSESLDGAGGVGGLWWVRLNTSPASGAHFVTYDGNGNVWTLVSASTGTETARYEYGTFGEPLRMTGAAAGSNPFRFSTKRTEDATGLVLYEYRAYSPTLGRWLSRDPIKEKGGRNLYGFVHNDPTSAVDRLGLLFCCGGKRYNPFTHCCIKGKIIKRGAIDTGIKLCSAPTQRSSSFDHVWLERDGWSAGFYPADDNRIFGGPGRVAYPVDTASTNEKTCSPFRLNPCRFDIEYFKQCLLKYIQITQANPPPYNLVSYNCNNWRNDALDMCLMESDYLGPCQLYKDCW
jgi:RHS repeat-associated protein